MKIRFLFDIREFLLRQGVSEYNSHLINIIFGIVVLLLLAFLADIISKKIISTVITQIVKKTETVWDDIILEKQVFNQLSHLAPAIVLYFSSSYILVEFPKLTIFVHHTLEIYMIVVAARVVKLFLQAILEIYQTLPDSDSRSIKGYVQIGYILIYSISAILILSILLGKSPLRLLAGLSAVAAVLLLVFKDTILGLVASVQISANKMLRNGDWITMPKYNADGTVIDITLNTVKVQNGDKTIVTIPTYNMVSDSFTNWRGMQESEGRRIKRSIKIDMNTVQFCSPELLNKLDRKKYLTNYNEINLAIDGNSKIVKEIENYTISDFKNVTNLGVFMRYLEKYLNQHPKVQKDLPLLVRQLQPDENGIPIEIVAFCVDKDWVNYERFQSEVFDHILAIIAEFELKVFQNPSGVDFRKIIS